LPEGDYYMTSWVSWDTVVAGKKHTYGGIPQAKVTVTSSKPVRVVLTGPLKYDYDNPF